MRVVSDEPAHIFELVAHSTAHGDSSLDVDVDVHSRGGGGWVCGRGENFGSRRQEQAICIMKNIHAPGHVPTTRLLSHPFFHAAILQRGRLQTPPFPRNTRTQVRHVRRVRTRSDRVRRSSALSNMRREDGGTRPSVHDRRLSP